MVVCTLFAATGTTALAESAVFDFTSRPHDVIAKHSNTLDKTATIFGGRQKYIGGNL
jgi:hypothetical protein